MFDDERVFDFCIRNGISIEQYAWLYFLMRKDFGKDFASSQAKQYVKKFGKFKKEIVEDLIQRGFVEDYNSPNENLPEFYAVSEEFQALFAAESEGEQLWNKYPEVFKFFSSGGENSFIARHASIYGTKEALIEAYVRKIKRNKKKHDFIMQMVDKYVHLVEVGKINPMKLGDWIANEVYDSLNQIEDDSSRGFDVI